MHDDKPFISWTYDPIVNRDRAHIIIDMLRFIREGLRDLGGPPKPHEGFQTLELAVKGAIFDSMQSPMANPIPKRMLQPAGDTLELLASAFLNEHKWLAKGAPIAAFRCGKITDELQQRINSFWPPQIDEECTSVATAFEMAFSNAARANTRLVLMRLIPRLLQLHDAPIGWGNVCDELWIRLATFQRDMLVFGGLAGGEMLKTAVRQVASQTCYSSCDSATKYSLIHFLQKDGYSPGRWMAVTEEGLANDIKAKYEAL